MKINFVIKGFIKKLCGLLTRSKPFNKKSKTFKLDNHFYYGNNMAQKMSLDEYMSANERKILQESEKLFVQDFLFPLLGEERIGLVIPQYSFIDSEGGHREIDFALITENGAKFAFEIDGESYHKEGLISSEAFDDSLFRQNEILFHDWILRRYSYSQLRSDSWRPRVMAEIKLTFKKYAKELLQNECIKPNPFQKSALESLCLKRDDLGWKKGLVVMPTGTGKTYLAALDCKRYCEKHETGKVLFIVHRNEILTQSRNAFVDVWGDDKQFGMLNGSTKENIKNARILFASMQTMSKEDVLLSYSEKEFDYIVIDEVHHAAAKSYQKILDYFSPSFLLGITATPERQDRKSVLELFDYQLVAEFTIDDAIDKGYLVGYEYHGLRDNIDYTKIKHNGVKYDVSDLEKNLIIDKRNEEIFNQFVKYCQYNKTLAFCVSIKHARAMADLFNKKGVNSVVIVSEKTDNKDSKTLVEEYRNNNFTVAFTVGIFNEGVDIPNIRCLMFLRPTESKTVFLQQLGRGLRLSTNKERVVVLDFIGNYKQANLLRQYLSSGKSKEVRHPGDGHYIKTEYKYNPKCSVDFEDSVQEILDMQDKQNHSVNKDDLEAAYFAVKAKINRKPNRQEIDEHGEYKSSYYISTYGSWSVFLQEIGEATESSFHYPQGFDFGHILYILNCVKNNLYSGNLKLSDVKMNGHLDEGRDGIFQRQTKYKLQGMMELKLLKDIREQNVEKNVLEIAPNGEVLYEIVKPLYRTLDLSFKSKKEKTWDMTLNSSEFVQAVRNLVCKDASNWKKYASMMMQFDAALQMMQFLYFECRCRNVRKQVVYSSFAQSDFVRKYCEFNGIEVPTETGMGHRAPFILSVLETMGVISTSTSEVQVEKIVIADALFDDLPINLSVDDVYKKLLNEKTSEEIDLYVNTKFGKNGLQNNPMVKIVRL